MSMPVSNTMNTLRQRLEAQDESVKRCHSLYDLETDKLMQHNQLTGKLDPEWKCSQYKICGSFVDSKRGESTSNAPRNPLLSSTTLNSNLSKVLEKKESFVEENTEQVVEFDEEMLTKSSSLNQSINRLSPFQSINSMNNLFPVNASPDINQNQLLQGMLKRQSMLDFEKSLQYFSPASMNMSFMQNQSQGNLFNGFLSPQNSLGNIFQAQNSDANSFVRPNLSLNAEHENQDRLSAKRKLSSGTLTSSSRKRGKWAEFEDKVLQDLASSFLDRNEKINFKKIAEHLPGRSAKQCREHWLSTLNPDLKKGRWTKAEEIKLLDMMVAHGKSWSVIAKEISGRAEHSVKAKGRLLLGERLKTIPPDGLSYEGSESQKQRLYELHQIHKDEYEEISKLSGYIVSPAKVERTMLSMCKCQSCLGLLEEIKNTNSSNLLQGWTKVKAKAMKEFLMKRSSKYATADQLFGVMEVETSPESSTKVDEKVNRLGHFSKLSQFTPRDDDIETNEEGELLVSIL